MFPNLIISEGKHVGTLSISQRTVLFRKLDEFTECCCAGMSVSSFIKLFFRYVMMYRYVGDMNAPKWSWNTTHSVTMIIVSIQGSEGSFTVFPEVACSP